MSLRPALCLGLLLCLNAAAATREPVHARRAMVVSAEPNATLAQPTAGIIRNLAPSRSHNPSGVGPEYIAHRNSPTGSSKNVTANSRLYVLA